MDSDLIDRIYEASVVPEQWPGILDDLAGMTDAKGGLLFSARDKVFSWTSSDNLQDVFHTYLTDGWFARCDRRVCMFKSAHSSFLIENDYWTPEEIESNPIYKDFFRPRDLGWSAGTGLLMPTGDQIVFSVERTLERGPMEKPYVERLNALRPHLARSAMIAARLGLKGASSASETLGKLGLPTILLSTTGSAIDTSNMNESASSHLIIGAEGRVRFKDKLANGLLAKAIEAMVIDARMPVQSFALRDAHAQAAQVAHIIPVSRAAHDIFARSYALLVLTPVTAKNAPPVELIRSLFDFTSAEARVARALACAQSVDDIAADANVSVNTVRTQVRKIMEKTGCTRQAEIVALMSSVSIEH